MAQGHYRYRVLHDFAGAEQSFEAVLQRSSNAHEALQSLGLVERRQGKWEQALAHLEQAANLDPRNAGLMVTIGGETLSNMNRFGEAREWLDRALALAPGNAQAIYYKVYSYQYEGRLDDAARVLDSVAPTDMDPGIAYARSSQRLYERRYTTAIAELQPLLALPEASLNGYGPVFALNLGIAQRAAGQNAQAQATFEHLIAQIEPLASHVDDSQIPVTLALAYAGAGRQQAALEQARRAVDLYRTDAIYLPVAETALAQVQTIGGDHDAAIATLEPLLKVPAGVTPAVLRLDPAWDPLRGDSRFQALLKEPADDGKATGPH